MPRKLLSGTMMILLIFVFTQATLNRNTFLASASEPSNLKIYVGPPSVLADNNVYDSIFVQLQDSTGAPARARQDTTIHLSSSLTKIGSVDPVITIPAGSTYAVAKFHSTYTPGSTTITAAAPGYVTVQTSIATAGPVPSKLSIHGFPPTIPADGAAYPAVVVQLQDSGGSPARAPIGDVNVALYSSNITVGTVDASVTIKAGNTSAVATFYTTSFSGSADITTMASGYSSDQTTITTQQLTGQAVKLKVYVEPLSVPADGVIYQQVAVQLQDSSGNIAQTFSSITVGLTSSDTAVGTVDAYTTIGVYGTYALADFSSTYKSGTTTIAAAATNYESGEASLTTVGPIPSKLGVYCVPPSLPADDRSYDAILVQLQDSGGNPANDPSGDISVDLFSSIPEAGNVSSTIVIPYGKTYSTASFFSTYAAGTTSITALTSDYETGQATVTTCLIDQYNLNDSITAQPTTVSSNEQVALKIYVTYNGLSPAPGITIKFTSDNGGTFSAPTDEGNGYYDSNFTAPFVTTRTVCTIRASASRPGYNSGQANAQVIVNPIILNVSATAQPDTVNSSQQTTLRIYVAYNGTSPASGATIEFTSDNGGNFSAATDEGNGYYDSNFTAPTVTKQTICTITATASKLGYVRGQANAQVTVNSIIHTGSMALHIKDNGNPVSEADIASTQQPTGISSLSATTDDTGNAEFDNIPAGTYTIRTTKSGYDTANVTITITAGETADTTINLTKTPSPWPSTPILIAIISIIVIAIAIIAIVFRRYHISFSTGEEDTEKDETTQDSEEGQSTQDSNAEKDQSMQDSTSETERKTD
jgi:hypothetical protein